jgi:tetratricopeptide (TPR) repeat protein
MIEEGLPRKRVRSASMSSEPAKPKPVSENSRRRFRVTVFFSALLITSIGGSALLLRQVDRLRTAATLEDVLYISSPKLLKRISLGYEGLLADIYWTRAVQYYGGRHHVGAERYDLLWPLLNITTQLDPHLIPAYEFGGTFLSAAPPIGAGLPREAIQLVEWGIRNNPDDWHLYYDLGFIYYEMKEYRAAASAFERGTQVPRAHPFLQVLAARMAEHGGDLETARMLWTATYQTTPEKNVRANAAAHLRALRAEEDILELEKMVEAYRGRSGHLPHGLVELVERGWLPGIPVDPLGHQYRLEATGRVVVSDPDDLPFLSEGLPSGYTPRAIPKIATPK